MFKDIDSTHPNYLNLVAYFPLEGNSNSVVTDITGISAGTMFGMPQRKYIKGTEQQRNIEIGYERPNIIFFQGVYLSHLDSLIVADTIVDEPVSAVISHLEQQLDNVGMTDVEEDTLYAWLEGYNYTYDPDGLIIDSFFTAGSSMLHNYYFETNQRFAKYITAYGNFLDLGDGFTWVYDLTDYKSWFSDTIDLRAGDNRELIDLKFEFIPGIPPRDVYDIQAADFSGPYAELAIMPDTFSVYPHTNATTFGIRSSFSGHSFNNPTNCAEFCWRNHYIEVDEVRRFEWELRKECADNPLYPQGGTWIYDRSGWCPGSPGTIYEFDLTSSIISGISSLIGWGVDGDGSQYGNWNGYIHFISYGDPNFDLDIELLDIISPSTIQYHNRFNPICDTAIIEIRNSGKDPVFSVEVNYRAGSHWKNHFWTGSLNFMETARISIPVDDPTFWNASNQFEVQLRRPNGGFDDHLENNDGMSSFDLPPKINDSLIILYRSNSAPFETSWLLINSSGDTISTRKAAASNTVYRDTVFLETGCYSFEVIDADDDGLAFFANNDGTGFIRILNIDNSSIKLFEPDFGKGFIYQFTTNNYYVIDTPFVDTTINTGLYKTLLEDPVRIYPNPSAGKYKIEFERKTFTKFTLTVLNAFGKMLFFETADLNNNIEVEIDLSSYPDGLYFIYIKGAGTSYINKLVKLE